MIWFVDNSSRYLREEKALIDLAARATWLVPVRWRIDEVVRLVWEAEIHVGGRAYPIALQYPHHYPHVPPSVLPRDVKERWSTHQYGAGGELCLEWGPDNWHSDILGADMIESAYRLLAAEQDMPGIPATPVATRHVLSLGQELRGVHSRFVITQPFADQMGKVLEGTQAQTTLRSMYHDESYIVVAAKITFPDGTVWTDSGVSPDLEPEGVSHEVPSWRWDSAWALPRTADRETFIEDVTARGKIWPTERTPRFVLIAQRSELHLYAVFSSQVSKVANIPPAPEAVRLPADHGALNERKIAMVGCGSLGSKIATSLARSGVRRFLLIDDDIFLPANLVRHDLDWRDVGTHKADSLARRIRLVAPTAQCETRKLRLAAQEASAGVDTMLDRVAGCDLVVDATANANVFNLLSGVVDGGKASLVWCEVFGGGIGGLIARYRSGLEPTPQTMRAMIEAWCAERNAPFEKPARDYATGNGDATLIANDAEVSVIAAHSARFVLDTLSDKPSYPYSAYLIGLARAWIFDQPFDTHPIDVGSPREALPEPQVEDAERAAVIDRLSNLFEERENEGSAAA